jgi:hypothetical protein
MSNPKTLAAELFRACTDQMGGQLDEAGTQAAYYLFAELNRQIGRSRARHAFWQFAKPAEAMDHKEIKNMGIIDRLDMMEGGPNVKELARQIARENYGNPTPQQIESVERQIQKLNKKRNGNPFWPQRQG